VITRCLSIDSLGRNVLLKDNLRKPTGFIILTYQCRALEWLNLRKLYGECLELFGEGQYVPLINDVMFAWKYLNSLSKVVYRPAVVFRDFAFLHLFDETKPCICLSAKCLSRYLDSRTLDEESAFARGQVHVRTVDMNIIHHKGLRQALAMGLNHIPIQPTSNFAVSIATALDGFEQLLNILGLINNGFPMKEASEWLRAKCLEQLKNSSKANKYGFRSSEPDLMKSEQVKDEIAWLTSHLFCSGLDKAANNACFICIKHIRLMALERLCGPDFMPCRENSIWDLPSTILDLTAQEITGVIPELQISYRALPYLMCTYKLHKDKYRWLTNAFQTVYSNLAHLLTITTMLVLEMVKEWAMGLSQGYTNFLKVNTSLYWLVNSSIEVALNLPDQIHDVFVADITRCYESIPLHGPDNLIDAVAFIIRIGFRHAKTRYPRASPLVWVRVNSEGTAAKASWSTSRPSQGDWFSITADRLIQMHKWLMTSCYVNLGDRVWKQILGIPMGFSCSPLWCNIYLLTYEIKFIQRLARLQRKDLLTKFQSAFRYIDDLCWINTGNPMEFLSPSQACTPDNPFWVYPLDMLEIKYEVAKFAADDPLRGIQAHFMNLDICVSESMHGTYETCKYDKRRSLPFKYTQYIMYKSNRPIKQSYSILVSQTVPILYLSSTNGAATREVEILIDTMIKNGFQEKKLRHLVSSFLSSNSFLGLKFKLEDLVTAIR
jgi:hypothetical protein